MSTKLESNVLSCPYSITVIVSIIFLLAIFLSIFLSITTFDRIFASTAPNQTYNNFRFSAVGDWGCNPEAERTVKNIFKNMPDLVLGLGDYSYKYDAGCWIEMIKPFGERIKIVIGNHDYIFYTSGNEGFPSPSLLASYMEYFNLTKQYYSFDYQNIHFLAMSTEVPYDNSSEQYRFIVNDLKKANADPKINWIVTFYHRNAYTSPSDHGSVEELRDMFHPIFEEYRVDLVLQAHAHNYQRSYPIIYNSEEPIKPIVTDYNETDYYNPNGQIFLIVGTGGATVKHNFTGPSAYYMVNQFNAYGFINIDIVENGNKLVGTFRNNNGSVNDSFMITKSLL